MFLNEERGVRRLAQTLPMGGSNLSAAKELLLWDPKSGSDVQRCRLCWGPEFTDAPLIAPCVCKEPLVWVHRQCLNRRRVDTVVPKNFTHCSLCSFEYRLALQRPPTESEVQLRERRQLFISRIVSDAVLGIVALQFWLCVLALQIRCVDHDEYLVKFFHFSQTSPHKAGKGTIWDAVLYHKLTYFTAAFLTNLAALLLLAVLYQGAKVFVRCCLPGGGVRALCFCSWPGFGCRCSTTFRNAITGLWSLVEDIDYFLGRCFKGPEAPSCSVDLSYLLDLCLHSACWERCTSRFCFSVVAVLVIFTCLLGPFFLALAAGGLWLKHMLQRLLQLVELKALAQEYAVQDLNCGEPCSPPRCMSFDYTRSGCGGLEISQSAPSMDVMRSIRHHVVIADALDGDVLAEENDDLVQRSLTRDLLAVFGDRYSAIAPPPEPDDLEIEATGCPILTRSDSQLIRFA
mmetsp:Transcript_6172/g.13538  ORF Transcript_6172/g.13538 Transcript_6172/m.13538 type:complete len:458 (+) Transcript_6172:41-1414(+)